MIIIINNGKVFMKRPTLLSFGFAAFFLIGTGEVSASERHFTFNYESPVLQSGGMELETYSTFRFGRELFYSALDQRLEFEAGLGGGVQTSLYLNFTQEMADDGTGTVSSSFLADGISNEWKFKLKDNLTDDFGLGLYLEAAAKPDELELEGKIIIDKRAGNFLWTFNLTNEPEYHLIDGTWGYSLIPSLGAGFFLVPERFFLGVEIQNDNFYEGQPLQNTRSLISAGPVLSYTGDSWWVTLTLLPQLWNLRGSSLDLDDSQRVQVRLAASLSLDGRSPSANAASSPFLPIPDEEAAKNPSNREHASLDDLKAGRDLILQRCIRCHGLHSPDEFSREGWEKIMNRMQIKAGLDETMRNSVLGYLSVFSREGK